MRINARKLGSFLTCLTVMTLLLSAIGTAPTLAQTSSRRTAIIAAGDRLASVQNDDGGFDWGAPDGDPGNASPTNTLGATAMGILKAHELSDKSSYETALAKAYKFANNNAPGWTWDGSQYNESTAGVNSASDITFLIWLAEAAALDSSLLTAIQGQVSGTTAADIAALAKTRWDDRVEHLGADQESPANGTATTMAQRIRDAREGTWDALIPWDLELCVKAALTLDSYYSGQGYDGQADDIADVIYDSVDDGAGTYFDSTDTTQEAYVLGLTGAIEAFHEVGNYLDKASELKDKLLEKQDSEGWWKYYNSDGTTDDKDVQSTAYAVMALLAQGDTDAVSAAIKAADWMVSSQNLDGSWDAWDGGTEYTEVDSEAAWALAHPTELRLDATPFPYDETIPRGVDGDAPSGWGDSCWQGPASGKSNYHVWYYNDSYGGAVNLENLFGAGHGLTVADLESISYYTKKDFDVTGTDDWWVTIYTKEEGDGDDAGSWYDSRLHARPDVGTGYSQSGTDDAWNFWSTDDGASATNQLVFYDGPRGYGGYYETLSNLAAGPVDWDGGGDDHDYSGEEIKSITLQTDSGWDGFDGYIDGLTIELKDGSVGEVNLIDAPEMSLDVRDPGWLATCEAETITVDVVLTANGFNGVQFDLSFDTSLVQAAQVELGAMWPAGTSNPQHSIDNGTGVVEFGAYLQQADTNISATDGQVARITFTERDVSGTSALTFSDVLVSNFEGQPLGASFEDGSLEVTGCGCVEGVVQVQGRYQSNWVDPRWGGAEVRLLGGPGGTYGPTTTDVNGAWAICDVVEGDYDVEVEMTLYLDGLKTGVSVPGDGTTTDAGQVKVLGGDCNDDDGPSPCGVPYGINVLDATTVGDAFGSGPSDGNWNEDADINDDDAVNILDASLLGGNWHKCSPVPLL